MSSMIDAIRSTLVSEMKTALTGYYPNPPTAEVDEYVGTRFTPGDPPAMTGQWYCAIHGVMSRTGPNRIPGNSYVNELWAANITITTRTAYAANSRIADPMALHEALVRACIARYLDRQWDILVLINAAFNADHSLTNGLTTPFLCTEPMPPAQEREPQWLKAVTRKKTSQINAISGTIRLSDALQIQALGNVA